MYSDTSPSSAAHNSECRHFHIKADLVIIDDCVHANCVYCFGLFCFFMFIRSLVWSRFSPCVYAPIHTHTHTQRYICTQHCLLIDFGDASHMNCNTHSHWIIPVEMKSAREIFVKASVNDSWLYPTAKQQKEVPDYTKESSAELCVKNIRTVQLQTNSN